MTLIPNQEGSATTPSWVSFSENERTVGNAAKALSIQNLPNTFFDIKRIIGQKFSSDAVKNLASHAPFKIASGVTDDKFKLKVTINGKTLTYFPEEISAILLSKLKESAEAFLNQSVTDAVITVPAYFNDSQRQATKDAGTIAGLNVIRIINEPTAAAIAYGFNEKIDSAQTILVYDFGGGTLDVSLLKIEKGVFEVLATAGNTSLGGEDLKWCLANYAAEEFEKLHKVSIKENRRSMFRLAEACETAKKALSFATTSVVSVDSLYDGKDFSLKLTRAKFETLCKGLLDATLKPVTQVLEDAKLTTSNVDKIIFVGGSSRIPYLQAQIRTMFPGKELFTRINPDEAIAFGAAVQASILSKNPEITQDILLLDVIPLTLGVDVIGDLMSPIVKRNTCIPVELVKSYTTIKDNQTQIKFRVYEGERSKVTENNLLGSFLVDVPKGPKGAANVDVTMGVDCNGILHVSAVEKILGKKVSITIKNEKGRLTTEEIEKLVAEAEKYKVQDALYRESMEAKHELEDCIYKVEKQILSGVIKTSATVKTNIETTVQKTKAWLGENQNVSKHLYSNFLKDLETLCKPYFK